MFRVACLTDDVARQSVLRFCRSPAARSNGGFGGRGRGGAVTLKSSDQRRRGTAMATVYVVTAASGESYRIERVYLDSEQAYGFAQDYNGITPVEPCSGGRMAGRCPAVGLRRPLLAGGMVGAGAGRQAARRVAAHRRGRTVRRLRHPPAVVDWGCPARSHGGAP